MYLHAGNNKNIRINNIIGIFDMDTATVSGETKKFIRKCDHNGKAVYISEEIPKSFILCDDGNIYISQISPSSLCGRIPKKYKKI